MSSGFHSNKSETQLRVALLYAYNMTMHSIHYGDGLRIKEHNLETLIEQNITRDIA
jgi:hypothetical protein